MVDTSSLDWSLSKLSNKDNAMVTVCRAMLLTALTVALVCTTELELSELDSAAIYAGRRGGGRLQTTGSFIVSGANRCACAVRSEVLNNGCSSSCMILGC